MGREDRNRDRNRDRTDRGRGHEKLDAYRLSIGYVAWVYEKAEGLNGVHCAAWDNVGNTARTAREYAVGYGVCLLYDPAKVKKAGSTVPVKLQICDASRANLSRRDLSVTAFEVRPVASTVVGTLDDSGNANPDCGFRYDASLAGYIFNLSTRGLVPGAWELRFRVAGDPTEHAALFRTR